MLRWIFWCTCLGVGSGSTVGPDSFQTSVGFPQSRGSECAGLYSCLLYNVDEKLSQVQDVPSYRFTKDLWLGKVRDGPAEGAKSSAGSYRRTFGSVVKRAMDLFKTHSLFWTFAPGLDLKVGNADSGKFDATVQPSAVDTRTFGGIGMRRRIAFALLPIMYKMGVITTLLVGITVFTLKGLTIGLILLFFTLTSTFHKFKYGGFGPASHIQVPEKNVHIHIHSGGADIGHGQYGHPVHTSWERNPIPADSGMDIQYHHFTVDDTYKTTTSPYSYYYNK